MGFAVYVLCLLWLCLMIVPAVPENRLLLLSRSNSGNLEKYRGYVDAALLRFQIPEDISFVSFKFIADEISKNLFDCYPRNVSLYLTRGSPPVINPDKSKYPSNFMLYSKPEIHEIFFKSDNKPIYINLTSPYPGLYYAATFNPYTDPRDEGIIQHGLSPDCSSILDTYVYARKHDVLFLKDDLDVSVDLSHNGIITYKFYISNGVDHILISINKVSFCSLCSDLLVKVGRANVPENTTYTITKSKIEESGHSVQVWVQENTWYYVVFAMELDDKVANETADPISNTTSFHFTVNYHSMITNASFTPTTIRPSTDNEVNSTLSPPVDSGATATTPPSMAASTQQPIHADNAGSVRKVYRSGRDLNQMLYREYVLLKGSKADSFLYTFDLQPDANGRIATAVNVSRGEGAVLRFAMEEGLDVGGTAQFVLGVRPVYRAVGGRRLRQPTANHTIIACIGTNVRLIPIYPNLCRNPIAEPNTADADDTAAAIVLNRTSTDDSVQIPYPGAGVWYLTLALYCNSTCVPCNCSGGCEGRYGECMLSCEAEEGRCRRSEAAALCQDEDCTTTCRSLVLGDPTCASCDCIGGCVRSSANDSRQNGEEEEEDVSCNSSVLFDISSYPCVQSGCGSNGKCVYMLSEGFVYSTCSCRNNYKGWDCMDDSEANTYFQIVLELLLLVLSNMMFLPAAFYAYKRRYYVEMVVYLSTCFFSSFYHYCDAGENIVSVCILPLYALQFCDFYCGLMGIWVTLVAMAHLAAPWPSIAHMMGAIILGCGTTYDKQSIWVFVLPAAAGAILIGCSWTYRFFRHRSAFPNKKYLSMFMPVGLVVVALALLLYATLQTQNNYKYVHSTWHILMAIGIIILLPDETTFVNRL